MARIYLTDNLQSTPAEGLASAIQLILQQLQDQINDGPALASLSDTNRKIPQGMQSGDLIFDYKGGELRIGIFNGVQVFYASFGSFTGAITDTQHGNRSGGSLHDLATIAIAGFMSAGDKIKADRFKGNTTSILPPSLTEFPTAGDWGFHTDTNTGFFYTACNFAGSVKASLMT